MMGVINYIYPNSPQQLAAGFMVSFVSLLLAIYTAPFNNEKLNSMYQLSLMTQTLTLFCK